VSHSAGWIRRSVTLQPPGSQRTTHKNGIPGLTPSVLTCATTLYSPRAVVGAMMSGAVGQTAGVLLARLDERDYIIRG
jgi:hypothetical protein